MPKANRCIIYGGGGFIGSHLCDELLKSGYSVTVFDKLNFSRINISQHSNTINVIEGDFNNIIDLQNSLKGVDYVFHLVSSTLPATSNENPVYDVETNLISTLKLMELCLTAKIKKLIFISSGGTVYGIPEKLPISENHPRKPICSYGIVKKTIEDYLNMYNRLYGLDYYVFRLSNPYGERQNPLVAQGVIPVFLRKILLNEPIEIWGNGEIKRDYIYINDVVNLLVKSLNYTSGNKIFNVSTSNGVTLNELLEIMKLITNKNPVVNYINGREIDVPVNILDNSLAYKTFGWLPETDLKTGIRLTYEYLEKTTYKL